MFLLENDGPSGHHKKVKTYHCDANHKGGKATLKKIAVVFVVAIVTISQSVAIAHARGSASCCFQHGSPEVDEAIVNTAVGDLWNLATRAQSALPGSVRVQDFDAAIASNQALLAHFDEIGYWNIIDSNVPAFRERALSYQFSEADVARMQEQYQLRGIHGFPMEQIRKVFQSPREDRLRAFDEFARLGSREVFQTNVIRKLETERARLLDGFAPFGGWGEAVCNDLRALAVYVGVMCLAGCAPCCAVAPFLGIGAFIFCLFV